MPYPNDAFADAILLEGASGSIPQFVYDGSQEAATVEPGEYHPGAAHTLWWKWVAPADGAVTFTTDGSSNVNNTSTGLDTWLAIFQGGFAQENLLGDNDDTSGLTFSRNSKVTVNVQAGVTYHIQYGFYTQPTSTIGVCWLSWEAAEIVDYGPWKWYSDLGGMAADLGPFLGQVGISLGIPTVFPGTLAEIDWLTAEPGAPGLPSPSTDGGSYIYRSSSGVISEGTFGFPSTAGMNFYVVVYNDDYVQFAPGLDPLDLAPPAYATGGRAPNPTAPQPGIDRVSTAVSQYVENNIIVLGLPAYVQGRRLDLVTQLVLPGGLAIPRSSFTYASTNQIEFTVPLSASIMSGPIVFHQVDQSVEPVQHEVLTLHPETPGYLESPPATKRASAWLTNVVGVDRTNYRRGLRVGATPAEAVADAPEMTEQNGVFHYSRNGDVTEIADVITRSMVDFGSGLSFPAHPTRPQGQYLVEHEGYSFSTLGGPDALSRATGDPVMSLVVQNSTNYDLPLGWEVYAELGSELVGDPPPFESKQLPWHTPERRLSSGVGRRSYPGFGDNFDSGLGNWEATFGSMQHVASGGFTGTGEMRVFASSTVRTKPELRLPAGEGLALDVTAWINPTGYTSSTFRFGLEYFDGAGAHLGTTWGSWHTFNNPENYTNTTYVGDEHGVAPAGTAKMGFVIETAAGAINIESFNTFLRSQGPSVNGERISFPVPVSRFRSYTPSPRIKYLVLHWLAEAARLLHPSPDYSYIGFGLIAGDQVYFDLDYQPAPYRHWSPAARVDANPWVPFDPPVLASEGFVLPKVSFDRLRGPAPSHKQYAIGWPREGPRPYAPVPPAVADVKKTDIELQWRFGVATVNQGSANHSHSFNLWGSAMGDLGWIGVDTVNGLYRHAIREPGVYQLDVELEVNTTAPNGKVTAYGSPELALPAAGVWTAVTGTMYLPVTQSSIDANKAVAGRSGYWLSFDVTFLSPGSGTVQLRNINVTVTQVRAD